MADSIRKTFRDTPTKDEAARRSSMRTFLLIAGLAILTWWLPAVGACTR